MMQFVSKQLYYLMSDSREEIKLFDNQVSGKSAKFTDGDGTNIYKKLSQKQYDFYSYMETLPINSSQYKLKSFIPKFRGKKTLYTVNVTSNPEDISKKGQWMSHIATRNQSQALAVTQFIALENLSMGYKYPCMMDIKLGKKKGSKKSNKKFQNSTTNSHHFRINGMSNLYVQENQPHFISKYYFQKTSEEEIETHLSFFFYDGKFIDLELIKKCIDQTKQIILALECFKNGNFNSASLLICYDAYDHNKLAVKIIDFDQFYPDNRQCQNSDQNIIIGLKYIVWYLNNIVHRFQDHQEDIKNRKLKIFQNFDLIPEQKIKEFVDKLPRTEKQLNKLNEISEICQPRQKQLYTCQF